MLLVSFFQWWYGQGWKHQFSNYKLRVVRIADLFSIDILLKTLFAPWKQMVQLPMQDQSFKAKQQALVDNLISRVVGFFVRVFTLIAGIIAILFTVIAGLVLVLLWPFIPILPFILAIVSTVDLGDIAL